ncbi:hypothetical protein CYY_004841 [Polysphondylium violaceum]|uniref:Guanylate cyclase domain-containing protein n=1 Tax=Polysphondylium violaceum TaxID=133409 RepID=A0A8J4UZ03_9MYCE|nr:hypothetical protein CYY_004841 [Polysphondylium violaceum]
METTLNIQSFDDLTRKTIEYGRLMILDLCRIDEAIFSFDLVSELEIVMFSRRMTSRCSELSSHQAKILMKKETFIEEAFGIIDPEQLTEQVKFEIIKSIISSISSIITTIKDYNKFNQKGVSIHDLVSLQNEYSTHRRNMIQSWKDLTVFTVKASWKIPKFISTSSKQNRSNSVSSANSCSPPISPPCSPPISPPLSPSPSIEFLSPPLSPLSPPTSPPIAIPFAPTSYSAPTSPNSQSPMLSPVQNSNMNIGSDPLSSPSSHSSGGGSFSSLFSINRSSSSPKIQTPKKPQKTKNSSSSISTATTPKNGNPTIEINPNLFDLIFQLGISLINLIFHLKNQQRFKNKKIGSVNNNNNNQQLSTTPPLYNTPPSSILVEHIQSPPLSPKPLTPRSPPIGSLYIEQTKNNTLKDLLFHLTTTSDLLSLTISDIPPFSTLLNSIPKLNGTELLSHLENSKILNMFENFSFAHQPKDTTNTTTNSITIGNRSKSSSSKPPLKKTIYQSQQQDAKFQKYDKSSPIKAIFFNSKLNSTKEKYSKEKVGGGEEREDSSSKDSNSSSTSTTISVTAAATTTTTTTTTSTSTLDSSSNNNITSINCNSNNSNIIPQPISDTHINSDTSDTENINVNIMKDLLNTLKDEKGNNTSNNNSNNIDIVNNNNNNNTPTIVITQNENVPNIKIPELELSKLNSSNDKHQQQQQQISPKETTSSAPHNKKLNQIFGVNLENELTVLEKKTKKDKELSSKNKINLLTLSKHLKALKQTDEQQQRNSFNQFWLEGSTHKERQDKLPTDDRQRHQINSLGSYVSNLVIRGLLASATPIVPPHIENYSSCVLFADISGFTALTERLGNHGKEGVELLTKNLNSYFTILIKIVKSFGGDIVKFAGDAVLAHWPTNGEIINRIRIACECAIALRKKLHNFPVPGGFLTLHIGVGCGQISGLYVGGINEKVEFLIAGEALIQATLCEPEADPGEIYVSHATQEKMKPFASFSQKKGKNNYKLESITIPLEKGLQQAMETSDDSLLSMNHRFLQELPLLMDMEGSLKRFVPNAVHNMFNNNYLAELRDITVMFMNLSYGVPDPIKDLNKLQSIVVEVQTIVYKYEGTIRQFIVDDKGCVLIAAWGVPPYSHEDDPSRAVEASMEIVVNLFKLQVISTVGVTTGKCFCGDVGSDERREYAVVGDMVNLAARLMVHSQGGVLCDEETFKTAKKIEFVKLANPIKVKGKSKLINVYKPMKKITSLKSSSPRHMMKNKGIIGRHVQLRQMANMIDNLRMNEPTHVAIIEAEAGLGKSRFISEIKYSFCMGLSIFKGIGIQMNESISFYIWKQILATFIKAEIDNGYQSFTDLGPHVTLLNQILDIKIPQPIEFENNNSRRYSAPQRAEALQMLMLRVIQKAIPTGSIVIIDDAHFMDNASWTLTINACRQLENCLFIIAQRPTKEGIPYGFTQLNSALTKIQLEPLCSKEETYLLVERMLDFQSGEQGAIPDEIVEEIFNRSQGNHFVIEEMVNGLISNGLIDEVNSKFINPKEAIDHVRLSLPRTVTSLITSRVDRLSPIQQLELKIASVIGMPFSVDSLYRILPQDTITKQELSNDLHILERLDFIKSRSLFSAEGNNNNSNNNNNNNNNSNSGTTISTNIDTSTATISLSNNNSNSNNNILYSFNHTRTQEVIYDLMLFSQRRELHQKIAKNLEDTCTPQNSLYISLVHHYHSAQNNIKTIEYSTKAGAFALAENNNKEAIRFFQLALKCMEQESLEDENINSKLPVVSAAAQKKLHRRSSSQTLKEGSQDKNSSASSSSSSPSSSPGGANSNINSIGNNLGGTVNSLSNSLNNNNKDIQTNSLNSNNADGTLSKVPIEVVSITRKLGLALFNLGILSSSQTNLLNALKYLGVEMPPPPSSSGKPKLQRLARAAARQDSLTRFFTSNLDMIEKREAILCLILLSKISFHDCSRALGSWCSYVALQLSVDSWSLQSEAYSIGIRVLGTNGDNTSPLKYYAEVLSRSDETNGYVYGNSHQSWGIYMSGLGRWEEAEAGYQKSTEAAGKMGDKKLMEECGVFLSHSLFIMGQLSSIQPLLQKTLESSRTRGDLQIQYSALTTMATTSFYLGNYSTCFGLIDEAEQVAETLGVKEITVSALANYNILKAQVLLYQKDFPLSYEYCKKVLSLIAKCDANNFTTYEAYVCLPLILIKLLQNMSSATSFSKSKILPEINESIGYLEKFADVFPIGVPRLLLIKAIMIHINGKDKDKEQMESESLFKESKEKASKMTMAFEETIATYYYKIYCGDESMVNSTSIQIQSLPLTPTMNPLKNSNGDITNLIQDSLLLSISSAPTSPSSPQGDYNVEKSPSSPPPKDKDKEKEKDKDKEKDKEKKQEKDHIFKKMLGKIK